MKKTNYSVCEDDLNCRIVLDCAICGRSCDFDYDNLPPEDHSQVTCVVCNLADVLQEITQVEKD